MRKLALVSTTLGILLAIGGAHTTDAMQNSSIAKDIWPRKAWPGRPWRKRP
jgi:hypothetical protein